MRPLGWSIAGIATAIGAVAILRQFDVVEVRGHSMAPTLEPGDLLLVMRLNRPPRAGEVVLTSDPRDGRRELIKRVAALDGAEMTLLGDNGAASTDARTFGTLPVAAARWRVVGRYWPPRRIGPIANGPG